MSKMLLENLANMISQKQNVEIPNFPYQNSAMLRSFESGQDLPVNVISSDWETNEDINGTTLIEKSFKFKSCNHLLYFINDILKKSDQINHHPKITINANIVDIELTTHELNDVSDRDLEMAKYIDEVYQDVKFIRSL